MGSGSSKSKSQKSPPKKPVANVNKEEKMAPQEIIQPPPREIVKNDDSHSRHQEDNFNRKQQDNDFNRRQNEKNKPGKAEKKRKVESPSYRGRQDDSGLVFEDESDMENDIDEVLKIPMAIEYPKSKKEKNKKDKKGKDRSTQPVNNVNHRSNNETDESLGRRDENLPETYAQRLQRQQYKLQQDMLIRQKTLYRNPHEWEDEEEEDYKPRGFDASRFRNVNRSTDGKKDLFTTHDNDELMTPRYLQSGRNLDEVQFNRRTESPDRNVPTYNQSELDLMAEIERDLL